MVWGKRLFVGADYAQYQAKITQFMMANTPFYRQFIMVSTNSEHDPAIIPFHIRVTWLCRGMR
jgi:hypothetical protein